jgi:NAD(P)-dependent dehydrogenase (short-subunit alcohol dehydrogenase family)
MVSHALGRVGDTRRVTTAESPEQPIAIVTGANKGIGFEVARGLGRHGAIVYVGARQAELGEAAVSALRGDGIDARFAQLDVTVDDQVSELRSRVAAEHGRLDVLVNNAAIGLDFTPPSALPEAEFRATFETNVFGPVRMIQAFLPLLRAAPRGRIVNVSSDFGSLTLNSDPALPHGQATSLAYPASKAALNQVTVQFAKELRGTSVTINAVDPGFTDTDMIKGVGMRSRRTTAQAAAKIVEMALLGAGGPSGTFVNDAGTVPW